MAKPSLKQQSLILAIAGIPQKGPLKPNGRVFRRLSGGVPPFTRNEDGSLEQLTYEQAFALKFFRWLPKSLAQQWKDALDTCGRGNAAEGQKVMSAFLKEVHAYKEMCPPPWQADLSSGVRSAAAEAHV